MNWAFNNAGIVFAIGFFIAVAWDNYITKIIGLVLMLFPLYAFIKRKNK